MQSASEDVERATSILVGAGVEAPAVAVILGSGLGIARSKLDDERNFGLELLCAGFDAWIAEDRSLLPGHERVVVAGRFEEVPCLFFLGRVHEYEGATAAETTFPVRLAHRLGARRLVATNAAGGITRKMIRGSLVLIRGHLDFPVPASVTGSAEGHRIAYDSELGARLRRAARSVEVDLRSGIYARVSGPSYETPAEICALELLGADVVGMSTLPEIVVANLLGMKSAAISVVTNRAAGRSDKELSHQEVLTVAHSASAALWAVLRAFISGLRANG